MTLVKFLIPGLLLMLVAGMTAAIAFGGPATPKTMASINEPFNSVDFSDVPDLKTYNASDGTALAYRHYVSTGEANRGSVVLVHGSSARSDSMHVAAKGFTDAGYDAYTLDIRGHGVSGERGQIDYIGQLEDDVADFIAKVKPAQPATLAGFSSGGGFVLRFAGSKRQTLFNDYLLMAPFISQDAPSYRPDSGGWVSVGLPRIIGLSILNGFGIRALNDLPVTAFALDEKSKEFLTPAYSFALATNFRPLTDYKANIRAAAQPVSVIVGTDDEAFYADQFQPIFETESKNWPVTLVRGVGHIPLTLEKSAIDAAVAAVIAMRKQ